jgi:hypothetical protein
MAVRLRSCGVTFPYDGVVGPARDELLHLAL